jgi:hypothetical protein
MKLSVKVGFTDKDTSLFRNVGEVVEYPESRAKELEKRGFGKIIDEPKPTKVEKVEVKEEKPKTEKKTTKKK